MTTSAQVRAAWADKVWAHTDVTSITEKIHAYDVTANLEAKKEVLELYSEQAINAFTYVVSRRSLANQMTGGGVTHSQFEFEVDVNYFLEKDLSDSSTNYNNVVDRLEVVDGLVISQLGSRWNNTVLTWTQADVERPQLVTIDGKEVWRGTMRYEATAVA